MEKPLIYTIGHSTHPIEYFVELLELYRVNYLVDVRSLAASRFNPQYNKKSLDESLSRRGVKYLHLGQAFGARQTDPALLDGDGRVDFNKMRRSEKFKNGIIFLKALAQKNYIVGVMCSESDPLHCHRFSMLSPALNEFEVKHILKDSSILTQKELEQELLKLYARKLSAPDIFSRDKTPEEQLKDAYELCSRKVAYSPSGNKKRSRT